jgi:hypothetical protein
MNPQDNRPILITVEERNSPRISWKRASRCSRSSNDVATRKLSSTSCVRRPRRLDAKLPPGDTSERSTAVLMQPPLREKEPS